MATTPRDWRLEGAPRRPLWLRALKWAGWTLLVLLLAVALFLAFFDLNRLRGPIGEWASARLGKTLAIRGPLAVDWSWTPRLTVGCVELADAAWSKRREMFTLKRAEVSLSLPELFKGHLVLPDILVDQPRLNLERDAKGRANWDLGLAAPTSPPNPRWVPRLGRVRLTGGHVLFEDAAEDAELDVGRISELIMEAAGLDIAEIVGIVATGRDRAMLVECMVGDFILSDGVAKTKLLLDTSDTRLQGAGQVDLHDEALDLRFVAQPKDPSVFSARTPLRIEGTLKQPKPRPEVLPLAARAAASVALGAALTPAAAVLPWIELGLGQDSPCRSLVNAAEKAGGVAKPGKPRR